MAGISQAAGSEGMPGDLPSIRALEILSCLKAVGRISVKMSKETYRGEKTQKKMSKK